jgi:hypothetical protein
MSDDKYLYGRPGYLRRIIIRLALKRRIRPFLSDRLFLSFMFNRTYGRPPDFRSPKIFDEKILWYNLYYKNPIMTIVADKYAVRGYLEKKGFGWLLNKLYGVYDTAEEIDLDRLPEQFVIKATHGSSMNIICRDKKELDWGKCQQSMRKWLQSNYFNHRREWAYKNIKPRLICEKYLENEEYRELLDYKFYCYNNRPAVVFVCTGRYGADGVKYNAYDMDWKRIQLCKGKPSSALKVERPSSFVAMIDVARELCKGFPFVRVDLYSIREKLIFGELTFYPDAGLCPFTPLEYNNFFGDLFALPDKMNAE